MKNGKHSWMGLRGKEKCKRKMLERAESIKFLTAEKIARKKS